VLGGMFGYVLGWQFYELIGEPIIQFYGYEKHYAKLGDYYQKYGAWAVFIAGLTPIPYKFFTIASGAFYEKFPFFKFLIASIISRSARFFLVSVLIWILGRFFGPEKVKDFIDKYFNLLVIIFTAMLIGGFLVIKYVYPLLTK
jgi:membrane protein YqaA with SNARE-associated domain